MKVTSCERCPALVANRNCIVNAWGNLTDPDILYVGEAPGQNEDEQGRPFVGAAGNVLATLNSMAGVPVDRIGLDNAARCRPPGNRTPYVAEWRACREYLLTDLYEMMWWSNGWPGGIQYIASVGCSVHGKVAQARAAELNDAQVETLWKNTPDNARGLVLELLSAATSMSQSKGSGPLGQRIVTDILSSKISSLVRENIYQTYPLESPLSEHGLFERRDGEGAENPAHTHRSEKLHRDDALSHASSDKPPSGPQESSLGVFDSTHAQQRVAGLGSSDNTRGYASSCSCLIIPNRPVVVTLGATALASLYKQVSLKSVLGQTLVQPETGIPLIPTYHPAFLFQKTGSKPNWQHAPLIIAHMKKAWRLANGLIPQHRPGRYFMVKTLDELRALRDYLATAEVVAFDTETTGLDWMTAELLCLQVSAEPETGFAIPILHNAGQPVYTTKHISKKRQKELYDGAPVRKEPEQFWLDMLSAEMAAGNTHAENFTLHRLFKLGLASVQPLAKPEDLPSTVTYQDGMTGKLELFWGMDEFGEVLDCINDILSSPVPKAAQNAVFDLRMLERSQHEPVVQASTAFGFQVNNLAYDTMLAAKVVDENVPSNLTVLTALHSDVPYYEEAVAKYKTHMQDADDEDVWLYGATDVDVVQRIRPLLMEQVEAQEGSAWLMENIQIPLVRLVTELQKRGVLIDKPYFDQLCQFYQIQQVNTERNLREQLGYDPKLDWQALQRTLFDDLKLPLPAIRTTGGKGCQKCTKEQACRPHAGTGKAALEELWEKTEHPVLRPIMDLKKILKFSSTYLAGSDGEGGYGQWIRSDGRIHASWGLRTETGRLACENPNMMNIPKKIEVDDEDLGIHEYDAMKRCIVAPLGSQIMNADWSQLEVWGLAYKTGDPVLMDLLLTGQDVHVYVARKLCALGISRLFPKDADRPELSDRDWQNLYEDIRGRAKVFVFGLSYGLSAEGAAVRLGCLVEEAGVLIEAFLRIFPTLPIYFSDRRIQILNPPYAVSDWAGRWRHFLQVPVLQQLGSRYTYELETLIREGYNMPIQGGGHDLHVAAWIATERNEALMRRLLPIIETHDSLTFEAVDKGQEYLIQTAWMLKDLWETTAKTLVGPNGKPLGWQVPVVVSWGPSLGTQEWELTDRGQLRDLRKLAA